MDLIIGGGITGLSYGMFSKNKDYLILEKENEVGGYCKTTVRGDYIWDYSGHFFHFQNKEIEDLILSNSNKSDFVSVNKNTKIQYGEKLIEYPFQANIHQLNNSEFIECLYDLYFIDNHEKDYQNFKEMLYAKFGKSISDKFLIPYNSKLYACDLNNLDKNAMGRFFPYVNFEDVMRNIKHSKDTSYNSYFIYPKNGAIEYVNSIKHNIPEERIITNTSVEQIDLHNHTLRLNTNQVLEYDRLISTIPFPTLLNLTGIQYDKKIYSWNKVLVFNLGFDSKGLNTEQHWIYFPDNDYVFYRVGFYDNILNQNKMSLYVEIGFSRDENIIPSQYLGRVLQDLKKCNIISEDQMLCDYQTIIMDPGYVHISSASMDDVLTKKEFLRQHNVYSIGRYGSWTYCSIEDNIKEAYDLTCQLN